MKSTKKAGNRRIRLSSVILISLIAILAISVLWLHERVVTLEGRVDYHSYIYEPIMDRLNRLEANVSDLTDVVKIKEKEAILTDYAVSQGPGEETTVVSNFEVEYPVHIVVSVESNSSTTYIEVSYFALGKFVHLLETWGTSGFKVFHIPAGHFDVDIGNTDALVVSHTVSVTYYY